MQQAIGLIEIKGLASAITVADTMAKVANIQLVNVERARGFGWTTIEIEGDVAAVNAAVEAGAQVAQARNSFVAQKVIPRPAENVVDVFLKKTKDSVMEEPEDEDRAEVDSSVSHLDQIELVANPSTEEHAATCNLCHDPNCSRHKGEPRQNCLHYNENN